MTKTLLALLLATGTAQAAVPVAQPQGLALVRVGMVRDFTLHFEHNLGAEEARRRVAARIESLRQKFGGKLEAAEVHWNGNEADIRVRAFSQGANGHVSIGDRTADVRVHLPLLLSAFGDQVRKVINASALTSLKQ